MHIVQSFEVLQQQVAEIRSLRLGFATNFYPDPGKNGIWIEKGDCLSERIGNTLFIVKQAPSFWNVFFCTTNLNDLDHDLSDFLTTHPDKTILFDIVGRDTQCKPLVDMLHGKGCKEAASLVRMTRMTLPTDYTDDSSIRRATDKDLNEVSRLLHTYFDEQTEQIPYDEELLDYTQRGHILICEEAGKTAGFLIYELNASTLYLRYWFTHPDFRDRKVGSRLLRRFFEEGKTTKRQLFWVIRTNENAIVRYRHYGFSEENMYDYVMKYEK